MELENGLSSASGSSRLAERAKYIPLRLDASERRLLRLLEVRTVLHTPQFGLRLCMCSSACSLPCCHGTAYDVARLSFSRRLPIGPSYTICRLRCRCQSTPTRWTS